MLSNGSLVAASVTVGEAMGRNNANLAKLYYKLIALYNLFANLLLCTGIYFSRNYVSRIFTKNEELWPLIEGPAMIFMLVQLNLHG